MIPPRLHPHDDDGTATVEMALILPVVFALVGMSLVIGWAFVNLTLLDRAGEIIAREVAIDGDQAGALAEAEASTPLLTITQAEVVDSDTGATITDAPAPGQRFAVTVTTVIDVPAAGLVRFVPGSAHVDEQWTLSRTARGLGQ